MLSLSSLVSLLLLGDQILGARGFAVVPCAASSCAGSTTSALNAMPDPTSLLDSAVVSSSSWLLSTIDADIANIPENEFRPVFMGGLVVMFGGLVSALVVGLILEQKDLYASVVADSYAQGAEDEEFWKGLSEEEKKKTQELLARLKENNNSGSKRGEEDDIPAPVMASESQILKPNNESTEVEAAPVASEQREPVAAGSDAQAKKDMFSDY